MAGAALKPFIDGVFRFSPNYELIPLDRLRPEGRLALGRFVSLSDFHAMLRPLSPAGQGIKLVCRDTATLIEALLRPGPLPSGGGVDYPPQSIAALVADDLLQIEHDGRFIGGPAAYEVLFEPHPFAEPQGPLGRISQAAVQYAEALAIDDAAQISSRLYAYNRIPLSAAWMNRLPSKAAVASFLGTESLTNRHRLGDCWEPVDSGEANTCWFLWRARCSPAQHESAEPCYKLYISPHPEDLPGVFENAPQILADSHACSFKVAADVAGVLRPDKFVAYFFDLDSLRTAAASLTLRLSGCRPHGVPFTASLAPDGLLSWGIDPPPTRTADAHENQESWRAWISHRLAAALLLARHSPPESISGWQFALERLRLHGIDPASWAPHPDFSFPAGRA